MLGTHWRRLGALLLLVAAIAILAYGADAAVTRGGGTGSTAPPTDPQYGNGGGGPGCGDPDEFGIYACPASPESKTQGAIGSPNTNGPDAQPRLVEDARIRLALLLQRVLGGVIR